MAQALNMDDAQRACWLAGTSAQALLARAGQAVLVRGHTYAAGDAVQALHMALDGGHWRAQATVSGTQDYQTELTLAADGALQAECDCPHASDGHFCKHQVALALAVHALLGGQAAAADPQARHKLQAAASRAQAQAANRQALRRFIAEQGAEALAERLWDWAERERHLMAELKSWAAAERAGSDPSQLKPAITSLLAARGFLDHGQSRAYAARARAVLPLLRAALQRDATQARALCVHALRRLFKAGEEADDSDGEIGGVMHEVMGLLKQAVTQAPPPAAWVDDWFKLQQDDSWGLWPDDLLLDVAGADFAQAWGRRVTDDWLACVARHAQAPAASSRRGQWNFERSRLRRRYLDHLKRSADAGAVIEAMRTHLTEAHEVVELVEYCESAGRFREAMQAAQQGRRDFAGDGRIEACLLRCFERDGWDAEALTLRRQAFERAPWSMQAYDALLQAAQAAGRDRASYRGELFAWAEQAERTGRFEHGWSSVRARASGSPGLNVTLRVTWLMHEKRDLEALALVQPPNRCAAERLWELALRLPTARRAQAVVLMKRVFDFVMPQASSPYQRELDLVRDITQRQPPDERHAWLAALRVQYKAKRNFIKGLPP